MKRKFASLLVIAAILAFFSGCNYISCSDTEEDINNDGSSLSGKSDFHVDEALGLTDKCESTDNDTYENINLEDEDEQKVETETVENNSLNEDESFDDAETEAKKDFEEDTAKLQETDVIDDVSQNSDAHGIDDEFDGQAEQKHESKDRNEEANKIDGYVGALPVDADTKLEAEMLSKSPAPRLELLNPKASGVLQVSNEYAVIDYSNTSDGYVMVKYNETCESRIKAQLKCATVTYSYNITPGQWETFPLSLGSGEYTLTVYRNVVDSKYASVLSASFDAVLNDEFTAFLYPNQYVNYSNSPKTVDKAYELTKYEEDTLMKLSVIYDFVVSTIVYDKDKAKSVASGYLPVLDSVLESKKGICFDYAALMTGMLRSQGIPCKLVVGYAGSAYHAWISVWTKDSGWIDGAIYFDGISWHRMDPTFASSSGKSDTIMQYIGDGNNYTEKYLY